MHKRGGTIKNGVHLGMRWTTYANSARPPPQYASNPKYPMPENTWRTRLSRGKNSENRTQLPHARITSRDRFARLLMSRVLSVMNTSSVRPDNELRSIRVRYGRFRLAPVARSTRIDRALSFVEVTSGWLLAESYRGLAATGRVSRFRSIEQADNHEELSHSAQGKSDLQLLGWVKSLSPEVASLGFGTSIAPAK